MKGETSTAPILPPPGPGGSRLALVTFGGVAFVQHAVASAVAPGGSASSKVTISRPSFLNAGDARIFGTHVWSHALAEVSPPGLPSGHLASWPSLQRLGGIIG